MLLKKSDEKRMPFIDFATVNLYLVIYVQCHFSLLL